MKDIAALPESLSGRSLRRWRVVWVAVFAALPALLLLQPAYGQAGGGLRINVASVNELQYPLAQAVVNLENTSGTPLGELTATNFTVNGDGQPMPVTDAQLASSNAIPLDVLLLMDTSGSTEGEGLAQAKNAAVAFVEGLAPEDRVAVMRFANSVTLQQEFTTDKQAAIAAINGLVSRGQTELFKATDTAVRQAATSASARRAMILLTDGASDAIETGISSSDALATARSMGVPVFTIAQGAAIEDPSYLIELANVSNGRYLEAPTPGDLNGVYQSIGRLLQNQYVVTFDASSAAGKPETAITVQVDVFGQSASANAVFRPSAAFVPPTFTISGMAAGESITAPREVSVVADGSTPIEKASFYVDGVKQHEVAAPPFTYTYDPDEFAEAEHKLRVAVTIGGSLIDSPEVVFTSIPSAPVAVEPSTEGSGGGGGLPVLPIALGIGILAVLAGAFLVVQRVRMAGAPSLATVSADQRITPWVGRHRTLSREDDQGAGTNDQAAVEEVGEALGVLVSRAGSDAGQEYAVGGKPISIGYGSRCGVRINDANLGSEEARIWIRNKTLMLHRMSRLTAIATDGTVGGWTMLEPGETFAIRDHVFEFKLLPGDVPSSVEPERADGPAPDIFKDRRPDTPEAPATAPTLEPGLASNEQPQRLTDMMPRDLGFNHQELDGPDQQAS